MKYKIDLHTHTNCSIDGVSSLVELLEAAKERKLDGFVVSDHNLCSIKDSSWNLDKQVLIIPGCEISTTQGHVVGAFLKGVIQVKELWKEQLPSMKEAIDEIHAKGGIAILAHPFAKLGREGSYYGNEIVEAIDCVETVNARACFKNANANSQAEDFAKNIGRVSVGGSDAHSKCEIGNAYTEVEAEALTLDEIEKSIRTGNCKPCYVRNTSHIRKGISQFYKAKRSKNLLKVMKAIIYFGYCICLDIFKPIK